jgi:rfaE bifunctional protein kinase chain/domain
MLNKNIKGSSGKHPNDVRICCKHPNDVSILVVGDIMLDRYIVGDVDRISPEAPVPIVNVKEEYTTLGGSGNVVHNLVKLGCNVGVLGIIGEDTAGSKIMKHLGQTRYNNLSDRITNYIYSDYGITTTEKVRIISSYRDMQMLRYDREMKDAIDKLPNDGLEWYIGKGYEEELDRYDVIVVSDYAKGMINWKLMRDLKLLGKKIIVDPKPINAYLYNDVWCITPNEKEYKEIYDIGMPYDGGLNVDPDSEYILRTMGKNGIDVIRHNVEGVSEGSQGISEVTHIDCNEIDVYNVTGAGDTVVAVFALCTALGMDVLESAKVANLSAGYVVTRSGTSIIPYDRFIEYMNGVLNGRVE